ncbi:DUF6600 domain-containing protein [Mucilaginibacter segetis]|uniref:Uncharacterized protein n=1 Tax=Mucilaginibacter segetis TaxID=2793071 RepID=A0A934PS54_9SPHI|nr:DUF6600 domain-containing protein [Mucilaginibacter segetis]MBK0377968.1 hypothetical protein [Mucilaginibacter segetis]
MKILNKIWGIGLLALLLITSIPDKGVAQYHDQYISEQDFYDQLDSYGVWIDDPDYGDVWVPDVDENFRPYATDGHWVLTSYGNTWVSDYPWGWATFHYGRWRYDNYYGWEWIPGYEWAPAWVTWRGGNGYYGWAPLSPDMDIDIALNGGYDLPDYYWVYAPQAYINEPDIYNYYIPYYRVVNIYRHTNVIHNVYVYRNRRFIAGPNRSEIQRYVKRPVRVYQINNVNRAASNTINNNTINIYRPGVKKQPDARPARLVDANAYKQTNPNNRIGSSNPNYGQQYNRQNASRLADAAKSNNPDTRVIRINKVGVANPTLINQPADNVQRTDVRNARSNVSQQQSREQQRQQLSHPGQQTMEQQRQLQEQQSQQQAVQEQQAREQQRQQQASQQRVVQEQQAREQQRQQQVNQQRAAQEQQAREQQRQQQANQQRAAQEQQAREQQRQQQKQEPVREQPQPQQQTQPRPARP